MCAIEKNESYNPSPFFSCIVCRYFSFNLFIPRFPRRDGHKNNIRPNLLNTIPKPPTLERPHPPPSLYPSNSPSHPPIATPTPHFYIPPNGLPPPPTIACTTYSHTPLKRTTTPHPIPTLQPTHPRPTTVLVPIGHLKHLFEHSIQNAHANGDTLDILIGLNDLAIYRHQPSSPLTACETRLWLDRNNPALTSNSKWPIHPVAPITGNPRHYASLHHSRSVSQFPNERAATSHTPTYPTPTHRLPKTVSQAPTKDQVKFYTPKGDFISQHINSLLFPTKALLIQQKNFRSPKNPPPAQTKSPMPTVHETGSSSQSEADEPNPTPTAIPPNPQNPNTILNK
ncbi:hypothetical protein CHS0354_021679 [Potamilus streckersoni]|uniref:Uncharacterized protein n=1 Tax=Potamilus streckersoni TaxID=2493646 RepID=A0AAE0SIZ6_9BIVA|nr:hypothetical protein CHS0354_021679 [Potamilus streckersoni]